MRRVVDAARAGEGRKGKGKAMDDPSGGAVAGAITDATLLVKPAVAVTQAPEVLVPPVDTPVPTPGAGEKSPVGTAPAGRETTAPTRYYAAAQVDAERYSRDFNRISQEVLQHLAAIDGVELDITVEISARCPNGFPEDKIRVSLENARALKFDQSGFESN